MIGSSSQISHKLQLAAQQSHLSKRSIVSWLAVGRIPNEEYHPIAQAICSTSHLSYYVSIKKSGKTVGNYRSDLF